MRLFVTILAVCLSAAIGRAQPLTLNDPAILAGSSGVVVAGPVTNSVLISYTNTTAATSYTTGSYTPSTSGSLLLAFICIGADVTNVTGNGVTWEMVSQGPVGNAISQNIRPYIFRAMGAATSGALTVKTSASGVAGLGTMIQVQEWLNTKTGLNGANAIRQAIPYQDNSNSIAPLATTAANTHVGFAVNQTTPPGATLESNWVQDFNSGSGGSVQMGAFIAHRLATTDNTFTTLIANRANVGCLDIEIVSANTVDSDYPTLVVPSDIANLAVWVRSDTGVYTDAGKTIPATNGALIQTWDNMGNTVLTADFTQATANNRPIYTTGGGLNSQPRVQFFGTNSMRLVSGTFAQPFTVVVIGKFTGAAGNDVWFADDSGAFQFFTVSSTSLTTATAGTAMANTVAFTNGIMIMSVVQSGNFISQNVVNQRNDTSGTFIGFGGVSTAMRIGDVSSNPLDGDEYEIMFFSRALLGFEQCQLNLYAKSRYALTY